MFRVTDHIVLKRWARKMNNIRNKFMLSNYNITSIDAQ